jgi:hypothetical protein
MLDFELLRAFCWPQPVVEGRLTYRLYPLKKCTTATAIRLVTGNPSASSESTTKNTP